MVEPEDRVESRVIQVGHMTAAAGDSVNYIVDGFQAVHVSKIRAKCV